VVINWEKIKSQEKEEAQETSVISGIPRSLPALLYAYKLQSKAARVGFDWEEVEGALDKVAEEISELKRANKGEGLVEDELGDILFAVVNVARHLDVDPELALKKTCKKFESRFRYIEQEARRRGEHLSDMTLEEKDKLWDKAKGLETRD
jgi:tetrapyrrole methylase family protein/MazG family protein